MSFVQDDIDVQKRGFVEIFYNVANTKPIKPHLVMATQRLHGVLPIKVVANHACGDGPLIKVIVQVLRPILSLNRLSRIRVHYGKPHFGARSGI